MLLAAGKTAAQQNIASAEVPVTGKSSCFLFSSKGFFYTATSDGLFLFDGMGMIPLSKKTDSLPLITALGENSKGELWIGCTNGAVYSFINNKLNRWQPTEGLPKAVISSIAFDAQNNLWLGTKGEGVYVYYQQHLYNINTDDGLSDNYVYQLQFQKSQMIAATDKGISLCRFDGKRKQIRTFTAADGLPDNIVQSVSSDGINNNIIWLAFENGCAGTFDLITQQYSNTYCGELPVNQILALEQEIWLAGNESVIVLNRTGMLMKSKMTASGLLQMAADAEANIWLLQNSSFKRTIGEQIETVITLEPGEAESVHDLIVSKTGRYWVTTKNGVACYETGVKGLSKKNITLPLRPNSEVTCLHENADGVIWVGTMGDGIFMINESNGQVQHLNEAADLQKASILSITGNNRHLWITSLEGVWRIATADKSLDRFNTTSVTGSAYIYYVLEDRKDRVWFGTDGKGLTLWENGTYKTFREKEGLNAKVIYSLAEDKNGIIWCNTLNNGIYKFDGKTFKHFGLNEGLTDLSISSITTDADGNIFCVSATGCFIIDAVGDVVIPLNNAAANGTLNTNLNSNFASANGRLFHAGNHIYNWRKPKYQTVVQPQTRILGISLFLDELQDNRNRFSYSENNLSFRFTGFYYSNPAAVSYQYKLEGYNQEWQTTKDGFVNFPKLVHGTYRFRVRSSANGSFLNADEAVYTFTINKPFWKQWWFLLLSIGTVTAVIISIIKIREKELQKMQQLQTEKLQSQYETLKNQVNPHFLFNSFNTLLTIIEDNPSKASAYVEHLSDFYRSIVNLREKDLIPMQEEFRIIEHYFFIQKKRFGDALRYHNSISEEVKANYQLPPLSLQMLAENAIKHNVVSREDPLTLSFAIEQDYLVVSNNLNPKLQQEKSEGLGLQNIKNRFQLIASREVLVEKNDTHFIVKLPLIKST
ncbi:MAG: histidine kinase [Lacibacter sp.]